MPDWPVRFFFVPSAADGGAFHRSHEAPLPGRDANQAKPPQGGFFIVRASARITGGRPRAPVTFFLLAHKRKSPKKKGAPFAAENRDRPDVWVCPGFSVPCAARPARRSSNSRTFLVLADISGADHLHLGERTLSSPILARNLRAGLRCSASLRGPKIKIRKPLL